MSNLRLDDDLDRGYLRIYHRKFMFALIEDFNWDGGFRRGV